VCVHVTWGQLTGSTGREREESSDVRSVGSLLRRTTAGLDVLVARDGADEQLLVRGAHDTIAKYIEEVDHLAVERGTRTLTSGEHK
jgi:hypothetical protein